MSGQAHCPLPELFHIIVMYFVRPAQVSDRELRKLNDKQRRLQETAARNKADALRDDDNVFDVSYESQGGAGDAGDTVSATDIKVQGTAYRPAERRILQTKTAGCCLTSVEVAVTQLCCPSHPTITRKTASRTCLLERRCTT